MDKLYLDYAAATPVDKEVFKAMAPYFSEKFGNAGSIHSYGQEAMSALDKSRETVANAIGAKFNEIIFTSSATEANNLALRGVLNSKFKIQNSKFKPRLIVSAIEHESILETAKDLERDGVEVVYLPVDRNGFVDLAKLKKSINENTVLVSIMYANNEIGTIQPIKEIAKIIRNYKETRGNSKFKIQNSKLSNGYPLLHTDAVQAFQYLDCNVDNLHVDMMTLSSHKIYGPKGSGALYVRGLNTEASPWGIAKARPLYPILTGGGQEFGYRSSTENIPAIVGFAKAAELVDANKNKEVNRINELRNYLWRGIKKIYNKAQLNGSANNRLPNNLNIYLPGVSSEELIIKLDLAGIAISSGSACEARSLEPSYVIKALGFKEVRARESIRITLGRPVTKRDLDNVLGIFKIHLKPIK